MTEIAQTILVLAILWLTVLVVCSLVLALLNVVDYFEERKKKGGKK